MNKKMILSLGTLSIMATPIVAVVSCSATDETKRTSMTTELAKVLNTPLVAKYTTFTDASWKTKLADIAKSGAITIADLESDISQSLATSWPLEKDYAIDSIKMAIPGSEIIAETTSLQLLVTLKRGNTTGSITTTLYVKDETKPTVSLNTTSRVGGATVATDTLTLKWGSSATMDQIKGLISASDNVYGSLAPTYELTLKGTDGAADQVLEKSEIPLDKDGELSSGSYVLKASFKDGQGNTSDEISLNITIEAKPASTT